MSSVTSEEYLWSCELSAADKDYAWAPEVIYSYWNIWVLRVTRECKYEREYKFQREQCMYVQCTM